VVTCVRCVGVCVARTWVRACAEGMLRGCGFGEWWEVGGVGVLRCLGWVGLVWFGLV
jgi:hypothetical protein